METNSCKHFKRKETNGVSENIHALTHETWCNIIYECFINWAHILCMYAEREVQHLVSGSYTVSHAAVHCIATCTCSPSQGVWLRLSSDIRGHYYHLPRNRTVAKHRRTATHTSLPSQSVRLHEFFLHWFRVLEGTLLLQRRQQRTSQLRAPPTRDIITL